MVVSDGAAATEARTLLSGAVELVELPLDDSWMRDSGPIFTLDPAGRRAGVHFRFNAWGEKFVGWDRDDWEIWTTTIGLNIRIRPRNAVVSGQQGSGQ